MRDRTREMASVLGIGGWGENNYHSALRHRRMLGVMTIMMASLLQGCTADKHPSQEETSLANAAKDVAIPLEAGKMKNPLPDTEEIVRQGQ